MVLLVEKRADGKYMAVDAKLASPSAMGALLNPLRWKIMNELAREPQYPSHLADKLKLSEQKVFYHINLLKRAGLIEVEKREEKRGGVAKYFVARQTAFAIKMQDADKYAFEFSGGLAESRAGGALFLEKFITDNGSFDGLMVVGSPDPHGAGKARARDGHYSGDVAMFIGSFLSIPNSGIMTRIDTELRPEDKTRNLILIGGPITNLLVDELNDALPVRFDRQKNWDIHSEVSGTTYPEEECGIIAKLPNPFNMKADVIVLAGKRWSGTRAAIIGLVNNFNEVAEGNKHDRKIKARVVEGVDLDGDGRVDSVEFRE